MLKAVTNLVNVSQITGVLPVVNGGTGVTTSTGTGNTVLSAAPTLSGNVTLSTGNIIFANGQGIDFSATSGTGTSELLNDYEEGTWTPDLKFGGANTGITYTIRQATYTKTGRTVFIQLGIYLSSKGSATGSATISGLPFTVVNGAFKAESGIVSIGSGFTAVGTLYGSADANATTISLNLQNGGNSTNLTDVAFSNTTYFALSLTYTA